MEIFCLIYPDAVYDGSVVGIVENIVRSGLTITTSTSRQLDEEEARLIFSSRRFSSDYYDFCIAMTISPVWILHLEGEKVESVYEYLSPEQVKEIFVPSDTAAHKVLIKLGEDTGYTKDKLLNIIAEMRKKLAKTDDLSSREFAAASIVKGQQLYTYHISMIMAGFTDKQAFELTKTLHEFLLFDKDDEPNDESPPNAADED